MLPAGLSMLWEPVDAPVALRSRFGFTDLAEATAWLRSTLAREWGAVVVDCLRLVISDHNAIAWVDAERGPLVVKWSHAQERFERLAATTELLRHLAARGVPVAAPLPAAHGRVRVEVAGPAGPLSVGAAPEVDGAWLDVDDERAVRATGACLARLHAALAEAPGALVDVLAPDGAGPPLREVVAGWLAEQDRGLAPAASQRLAALLGELPPLDDDPRQLLHHDVRAANVLVRDSQVVAVLDLELVVLGHRVEDLAKASTYLGTRFTQWRPTPPRARRWLVEGYASVRRLSAVEERWLEALQVWHGLMAVPGPDDHAGWAAAI